MSRPPTAVGTLLLAGLIGCNPFDPFDPETPSGAYSCNSLDPRCPGEQICVRGLCVSRAVRPDGLPPPDDAAAPPDGADQKGAVQLDGAVLADAGSCTDAAREPNNSFNSASVIATVGSYAMEICYPGDVDHLSFLVPVGQRLRATIRFSHADGDLDAALLDDNQALVDESKGFGDTEVLQMVFDAPVTDRYVIGVAGYNGAVNTYSLLIELE